MKHFSLVIATILSLISTSVVSAQNFHYRKGYEYWDIDWERSAFSEWTTGMNAGEINSTLMVAYCYIKEYGTVRNVQKGISIIENLAARNPQTAIYAANFWFPTLDPTGRWYEHIHAGGVLNTNIFPRRDLKADWDCGLKGDYTKALKYARKYLSVHKSADKYSLLAKNIIGYCYANGVGGVNKNVDKALEYYAGSRTFYSFAKDLISPLESIEQIENIIGKLKPYIENENTLSSLDNKTIQEHGNYSNEESLFLLMYCDKYAADLEKRTNIWMKQHNPFENPEEFKKELKKLDSKMQSKILNALSEKAINTTTDSLFKIWLAYPCEETTYQQIDEIACTYTQLKDKELKERFGNDYITLIKAYKDLLKNPLIQSKLYHYDTFSDGRWLSPEYKSFTEYIFAEIINVLSQWENQYKERVTVDPQISWVWSFNSIPIECENLNICIGSSLRYNGRTCLMMAKDKLTDIITANKFIFSNFQLHIDDETINARKNIEQICDFVELLEKEDNKSITYQDYTSYLEKYPDAYYKQYCIDGYAMATADTFTLDTPKDEIKKLLDSGITKGAAKYVKTVTKKSYLKSKSL